MSITLKSDDEKVKTILDYYILTNKLKDVVRSGWKGWNVRRERLESIAEHIYGTCMLALAIWSETLPEVNISEVIMMLALHETEEIIIGDITPFDDASKQKEKKNGEEAVLKIFEKLVAKDVYFKLIHDFDTLATPEAEFAHKCDKLECDLQARLYSNDGSLKLENAGKIKDSPRLKPLRDKGIKDAADYFIIYDRAEHFKDNDIFLKINKYIQGNKTLGVGKKKDE